MLNEVFGTNVKSEITDFGLERIAESWEKDAPNAVFWVDFLDQCSYFRERIVSKWQEGGLSEELARPAVYTLDVVSKIPGTIKERYIHHSRVASERRRIESLQARSALAPQERMTKR